MLAIQTWERAIYTQSLQRPQSFQIVLFISKSLQRIAQNTYAIYLHTELCERKKSIQIIHTMSKRMNMPIYKQQIASPSKRPLV